MLIYIHNTPTIPPTHHPTSLLCQWCNVILFHHRLSLCFVVVFLRSINGIPLGLRTMLSHYCYMPNYYMRVSGCIRQGYKRHERITMYNFFFFWKREHKISHPHRVIKQMKREKGTRKYKRNERQKKAFGCEKCVLCIYLS